MRRADGKVFIKKPATTELTSSISVPTPAPAVLSELSPLTNRHAAAAKGGAPLELDMALIDEDPRQPRSRDNPGFSSDSLNELAASIRLRGVKTPISVRDNPAAPGRFLINHGARRFRGSLRAGKSRIPGFVDNDYNEADQVVENLQRNELTAREIADFIGRELAKGVRKGEIAKSISKSPAFVTQHVTLLDLPDPIALAFNSGRVRDVTVVNELVTAFKTAPQEVEEWLGDESQDITRSAVKLLRAFLDDQRRQEHDALRDEVGEADEDKVDRGEVGQDEPGIEEGSPARLEGPERLKKAIIVVRHQQRRARLILNRRPRNIGFAWLKYEDDGDEAEINLAQVQLVALL